MLEGGVAWAHGNGMASPTEALHIAVRIAWHSDLSILGSYIIHRIYLR